MPRLNWKRGMWRLAVVISVVWVAAAFSYAAWLVARVHSDLRGLVPYPASERLYDFVVDGIELSSPVFFIWAATFTIAGLRAGFVRRCEVGSARGSPTHELLLSVRRC
jgi:hypothetical protein